MEKTPQSNRIHIGVFGKRNAGKSSLINDLAGQEIAIVSEKKGTTTDPVQKSAELSVLGSVVLMDTAGFDDDEELLGSMRQEKTRSMALRSDIALLLVEQGDGELQLEDEYLQYFSEAKTPVIGIITKGKDSFLENYFDEHQLPWLYYERGGLGRERLIEHLRDQVTEDTTTITGALCKGGDVVMLVMPQDASAPKGRLILPQVQTIRELLDKGVTTISTTPEGLESSMEALVAPPDLIITDSQVFKEVYEKKPESSELTSFSVLFAGYKGDLPYYLEGIKALEDLKPQAHILIAEACTHAPQNEDIGRVKLPKLLRKHLGDQIEIDITSGQDYPLDLTGYDLIISCGACMFNKKHMLGRIKRAKDQGVPMTNYGVILAYLNGILEDVSLPL